LIDGISFGMLRIIPRQTDDPRPLLGQLPGRSLLLDLYVDGDCINADGVLDVNVELANLLF